MSGLSTPVGSASSGMMNVSESEATDAVEALEKAIKSAGSSAPGIWANVADRLLLLLLSVERSPLRRTSMLAPSVRR